MQTVEELTLTKILALAQILKIPSREVDQAIRLHGRDSVLSHLRIEYRQQKSQINGFRRSRSRRGMAYSSSPERA